MSQRNTAPLLAALLLVAAPAWAESPLQAISASELQAELATARAQDDVVLLNFWATWCRSCLEEIPAFMQLQEKYRDQGFRLVAVSLDDIDSMQDTVTPFMNKWFPEFASYIGTAYDIDDMVSVVDNGWNEVLPTSYLFARDGSLAERLQGQYSAAEFDSKISALLAQ